MRKCAFLTMDNVEVFRCYDPLLYEPLRHYGWLVEPVSWRSKDVCWDDFEVVVIRSPWDYQQDPEGFLATLEVIDQSSAQLENHIDLVEWNIDKVYLKDLESQGINIVPTLWSQLFLTDQADQFFDDLDTDEIVIKPTISAGAYDTFRLNRQNLDEHKPKFERIFKNRGFMVQPFLHAIVKEGEYSLFFFGDTYSHTILKKPKLQDFRVQEKHGGQLNLVEPSIELLDQAREVLSIITPKPLYSRVDFVRFQGKFALIELELVEPSLYFNMDPTSPERFAKVFDEWMDKK